MIEEYLNKEGFCKLLDLIKVAKKDLERAESVIGNTALPANQKVQSLLQYLNNSSEFADRAKLKLEIWTNSFCLEWSRRQSQK